MPEPSPRRPATVTLAWTALIANVVVILQGAVVRATGSGAGCGSHWPRCNGELVPLAGSAATGIEFSHRLLSLVVLALGAWLLSRAWRLRGERPGLFVFALVSFGLLIVEALLGGATVLLGYTGDDASLGRGLMVASHLVNSMLLVGALAGTVAFAGEHARLPLGVRRQGALATALAVGLGGMLVLMFSGGIAAMGNTIFPSASLGAGLAADFDAQSHPLIRLRILHPLIAVSVGVYLMVSLGFGWWLKPAPVARPLVRGLVGTYAAQIAVGVTNLALLAPIALQLLHLSLAVLAFGLLSALSVVLLAAPVPEGARTGERAALEGA